MGCAVEFQRRSTFLITISHLLQPNYTLAYPESGVDVQNYSKNFSS